MRGRSAPAGPPLLLARRWHSQGPRTACRCCCRGTATSRRHSAGTRQGPLPHTRGRLPGCKARWLSRHVSSPSAPPRRRSCGGRRWLPSPRSQALGTAAAAASGVHREWRAEAGLARSQRRSPGCSPRLLPGVPPCPAPGPPVHSWCCLPQWRPLCGSLQRENGESRQAEGRGLRWGHEGIVP